MVSGVALSVMSALIATATSTTFKLTTLASVTQSQFRLALALGTNSLIWVYLVIDLFLATHAIGHLRVRRMNRLT